MGPTVSVDPAQEALPLSVTEQATTPVSGALAGNPPPAAPPEPPPAPAPAAPPAAEPQPTETHIADTEPQPTDQATQAHPFVDANGNGRDDQQSLTSGDPLAPREHPES